MNAGNKADFTGTLKLPNKAHANNYTLCILIILFEADS